MGIYPTTDYHRENDGRTLIRVHNDFSGMVKTEVYELVCTIEDRTTCFCCSCSNDYQTDPFCRNHGWAGTRPCELHNMPGAPIQDSDEMPDSVQKENAYQRQLREQRKE